MALYLTLNHQTKKRISIACKPYHTIQRVPVAIAALPAAPVLYHVSGLSVVLILRLTLFDELILPAQQFN